MGPGESRKWQQVEACLEGPWAWLALAKPIPPVFCISLILASLVSKLGLLELRLGWPFVKVLGKVTAVPGIHPGPHHAVFKAVTHRTPNLNIKVLPQFHALYPRPMRHQLGGDLRFLKLSQFKHSFPTYRTTKGQHALPLGPTPWREEVAKHRKEAMQRYMITQLDTGSQLLILGL